MKRILYTIWFIIAAQASFAQLANVQYFVKINRLMHFEGGISGNCWEPGGEEYTGYAGFRDDVNATVTWSACQTCNTNGDCTYGQNAPVGNRTNAAYQINAWVDGWEDDRGNRCTFDDSGNIFQDDDDCRTYGSAGFIKFRELAFPTSNYTTGALNGIGGFGDSDFRVYYDIYWKYTGNSTASTIIMSCNPQTVIQTTGGIRSQSVYLTAGVPYLFETTSGNDTYLRLYGTDGYTIVALDDDGGTGFLSKINYTPATTGWYYIETSQFSRVPLSASVNLVYQIDQSSVVPAANDVSVCSGQNVTLNATPAGGGTIKWYLTNNSTPHIATGNTLNLGSSLAAGTYYRYVTETGAAGCESTRREVKITVKATPVAPVVADATICPGSAAILIASNPIGATVPATNFNWYNNAGLGTVIYTGANFNTGALVNPPASYTYYVAGTIDGCVGNATPAVVTFYTVNKPVTSGNVSICTGNNATLTASAAGSNEIRWYLNSDLTGYIQSGGSYTTPSLTSNITYYVTAKYPNGCESIPEPIVVTVNPAAATPILQDATFCTSESVILNASNVIGTITWYSDAALTTAIGTGTPLNIGAQAAGVYNYYARVNNGTCNSIVVSNTITVNTANTAPTSISGISTICTGGTTTLNVVGGNLGSGASWKWYSGSCGGTAVGTGPSITISPAVTTTYYARAEGLCANTVCVSQTVTVEDLSTAPGSITATLSTICAGDPTVLSVNGGSLGTGATWEWYTTSCGGTPVGTGASISVSPTSSTTYYVRAEGSCNTTACASFGITVNSISVAPTSISSTSDTVCIGSSTILSVVGGSLGTGATWQWYTNSCGGVSVGTGNSISVAPNTNTTYYVRAEGTCNTTTCAQKMVTTAQNPVEPVSSDVTLCENFPITLNATGNGGTIKWYLTNISTPEISTGNSLALGVLPANTYYRYVTETNAFGCESTRKQVEIIVRPIPTEAPVAADATICPGSSASLLATNSNTTLIPATNFNWYTSSALTTVVYTGAIYNTPNLVTPPSTYTFYVAGVLDGCISAASAVVVDFYQADMPIASNDTSVCNGDIVTLNASAVGSTELRWYTNGDLSGYIQSGVSFTTPSLNSNTTYYVTAVYPNGCESQAEAIVISINPLAMSPVLTDEEYCEGEDVILNANNITGTITWYSDAALTTVVGTGSPLNLGALPADTLNFFAQVNNGTCVSLVIANTVEIEALPTAPTLTAPTICAGERATISVTSAFSVNWYSDAAMTDLLYVGSSFTTPILNASTTYYVSNTNVNGCQSLSSSVLVTVNPTPAAPIASDEDVCENESATLTASGGTGTFIWYTDAALANQVGTGATFVTPNLNANTTYYVIAVYPNGCESLPKSIVVTVNPAAATPILQDATFCEGEDVILNANNITGTITWYSDAALTTVVGTGSPLNLGALPADTLNFFAQVNNGTCVSLVIANTVEIEALPTTPTLTAPTICAGERATISVTSVFSVNWYSDAAMTDLLYVGSSFTTPILNASTTYYVSNTNVNGCQSISSSVLVTVNPKPAAPSASDEVVCKNGSTTLTASGGTGTFIWYSDAALANQVGTGTTFVTPNLNANTSYFVVLDNGLCQSLATQVNVTVNLDIVIVIDAITDVLCNGSNTGSIFTTVSGGDGTYTYSWTGGGTNEDLTNAAAGNYVLTVTDGLGCTASNNATISSPDALTAAIDKVENVTCNGLSNGSIEVTIAGGTSAYTYSWNDGSGVVSSSKNLYNVGVGTYTLTITDANGCTETLAASITEPSVLSATMVATDILCFGGTGSASVTAAGGTGNYTYLWSNFGNTASVSGLAKGLVSVIVYDGSGCSVQLFDTVQGPAAALLVTEISVKDVTCFNGNDGAINTSISGGTAPYIISWSAGAGSIANATNLTPGLYTITVTDANLCTTSKTFEVENADEIIATMAVTNPTCYGLETGMIVVGNSGGTAPYTYVWNTTPVQTGVIAVNLPGDATYTVSITDKNGCVKEESATVDYPAQLVVNTIPTSVSCISSANGSVTIQVLNGNAPFQYELNGFLQADNVFDNLGGGNYIAFVRDNNNCVASAAFTISTISGLEASLQGAGNDLNFVTDNLFIVRGEEVSLNVELINDSGNTIEGYNWTPNYIDSTNLLSSTTFFPLEDIVVVVEVLENIGGTLCSVFDTLRIAVSQDMKAFVPTAFSPNQDGANNFFELNVLGATNLDVKIFNRWGQLIFNNPTQQNGPNNINDLSLVDNTNPRGAWDGKFNGEDVPTGAYAYAIEVTYFDGTKEVLSGSITVIR